MICVTKTKKKTQEGFGTPKSPIENLRPQQRNQPLKRKEHNIQPAHQQHSTRRKRLCSVHTHTLRFSEVQPRKRREEAKVKHSVSHHEVCVRSPFLITARSLSFLSPLSLSLSLTVPALISFSSSSPSSSTGSASWRYFRMCFFFIFEGVLLMPGEALPPFPFASPSFPPSSSSPGVSNTTSNSSMR